MLVLTNYMQPELEEEVKKRMADGYLEKNSSAAELKEAINIILAGGNHFPSGAALSSMQSDNIFMDGFLKKYQLTRREVDIIQLICREMSSREIAAKLFLSDLTINTHRRNIFRKLDIKNVAGLINFARQNELL